MKRSMRALLLSTASLVLCFAMLIGTTYAWFTDSVESGVNQIIAGNLDVELEYAKKPDGTYKDITNASDVFVAPENSEKGLWEPGHTEVAYLKVTNKGNLALKYSLQVKASNEVIGKNAENEDIKLSEILKFSATEPSDAAPEAFTRDSAQAAASASSVKLTEYSKEEALGAGESHYVALVVYMPKEVGNEANYRGDKVPEIDFAITLFATQAEAESDSFGSDYDKEAFLPVAVPDTSASQEVSVTDNKVDTATTIDAKTAVANIPEGVEVTDKTLTLSVSDMDDGEANVTLGENEEISSLNVHIKGVAKGNTVPMEILLIEAAPKGMNQGNLKLYHVENGATNAMLYVETNAAFTEHNQFKYDPATGDVILYMATFSEVAVVADTENEWEGKFDYSWYTNAVAPIAEGDPDYVIANADQLAAFGAIVGGMAKKDGEGKIYTSKGIDASAEIVQDSFSGKTVKLLADINLGDDEENNVEGKIFYPIGYWNYEESYEKDTSVAPDADYYSGFYAFEGTFDGNGNTIKNFYQNTWEMKGDHDWYDANLRYFRDGMGLFGKVYGGTVKNLIVDNYSCDSEIGTTGVIAAYADSKNGQPAIFENITITNCNPRVYNIGNGGIVGCAGWYSRNESLGNDDYSNAVTFKNITVDQTNKISALWGSWGVSCAGILGQYYPNSACGIKMENCHVAAIIDVNNDVCSNYQYYWYRYAGMFIGTIRSNTYDANGYEIADTTGVTATDCTYTMGNWNEYWYCEIVANTLASYTHDHQFSRLENIYDLSEISKDDGETWEKEGHFALLDENRDIVDCYHIFKNSEGKLYRHFHDKADESNPNIYESFDLDGNGKLDDLKEDRQRYFIPFNQLLTGLDMGIKAHTEFEGIAPSENDTVKSVEKFKAKGDTEIVENADVSIGQLFTASGNGTIASPTVQVYVSPLGYGSTVSATYSGDAADWQNGTLTFSGKGSAKVVITDYYYCTSTTLYVTVGGVITAYNKFDSKFTGDFLYRVGNQNTVKLDSLFKAKDGVSIGDVSVTVEAVGGTGASGTYTPNETWTNGTIKFNGTGVVKVTITDNNYCTPTELYLEVVDATNVTGLSGAISGNVVLLNDCGLSSLTIAGRNTVFGNGFTATYTGNGQYLNNGLKQGVITVQDNGTIDNLRVVASIYPYMAFSYSDVQKTAPTEIEGTKTRYYYQLSAISVSGNATVTNCYVYGGRTNIFIGNGNVTIKDTILECGVAANAQIISSDEYTVTLENVTTIQKHVKPTVWTEDEEQNYNMLGAGILFGELDKDATYTSPKLILNGDFKQYNWASASDADNIDHYYAGYSQTLINQALNQAAFKRSINGNPAIKFGNCILEFDKSQHR